MDSVVSYWCSAAIFFSDLPEFGILLHTVWCYPLTGVYLTPFNSNPPACSGELWPSE